MQRVIGDDLCLNGTNTPARFQVAVAQRGVRFANRSYR